MNFQPPALGGEVPNPKEYQISMSKCVVTPAALSQFVARLELGIRDLGISVSALLVAVLLLDLMQ